MVSKGCPKCKDMIPIACKTCPCGYKFSKAVGEANTKSYAPGSPIRCKSTSSNEGMNDSPAATGRPRRASAINSLYYHSSLHQSSYKLSRHAQMAPSGTTPRGKVEKLKEPAGKRKRGRPRLTPKPEEVTYKESTDSLKDSHSSESQDSSTRFTIGRPPRNMSESEAATRLYLLSDKRKEHFSQILGNINSKFLRNSNISLSM